jgi:hypothetical protein
MQLTLLPDAGQVASLTQPNRRAVVEVLARLLLDYSPTERMAILELMAARGWSKAQAGRHFLVTDDTVASWTGRIGEDEPGALVKATVPVNKFPDFVAAMVIKLKTLFPMMGRRRIAGFLARAGLHIAASTVRRMLNRKPAAQPPAPLASRLVRHDDDVGQAPGLPDGHYA